MKTVTRLAVTLTAILLLAASQSQAALVQFSASLNGPNEFPPNASPGNGQALVEWDTVAHTLHVNIAFSGLLGLTTAAHIHCCVSASAPNPVIGVATTVPNFLGFPLGVTSGVYDDVLDLTQASSFSPSFITAHGGTVAGAEAFLTAGMLAGEAYVNIHSNLFPGGEIRGFLRAAEVPEPGTISLLGMALVAAFLLLRRGRSRPTRSSGETPAADYNENASPRQGETT